LRHDFRKSSEGSRLCYFVLDAALREIHEICPPM
jgi:hypothetical protein